MMKVEEKILYHKVTRVDIINLAYEIEEYLRSRVDIPPKAVSEFEYLIEDIEACLDQFFEYPR